MNLREPKVTNVSPGGSRLNYHPELIQLFCTLPSRVRSILLLVQNVRAMR